ncbi:hypothetical protein [Planomonospora venezuelensis]|uniref:Uncharacterized protein n=1 Tax=Planomonospora venezuelensis TaxID=1999 RepID=A0A841CZF3_PLAVE|nr:hypothetical protein [Planomonospora venezuelensis]MBB5963772.1 hypothetical protein [Planomonospora venezuelensis]
MGYGLLTGTRTSPTRLEFELGELRDPLLAAVFVGAGCTRSSAACRSPVRRYAVRNSASE